MENTWVPLHSTISFVSPFFYLFEGFIVAGIIFLFFMKKRKIRNKQLILTEQQKDKIIAEWKPEPLVSLINSSNIFLPIVEGKLSKFIKIDGKKYLNLGTYNFLNFVGNKRIEEVAKKTIFKYGVGSCGPRGFYGTVDVHLALEKRLAQFMRCEEAILYSYGFATVASAIPAYSKSGDIIYADKEVNFAIQKGIQASRSKVEWFKHNDFEDLEKLLKAQAEKDKKNLKKASTSRRFIIIEGLYAKTANLCPLKKILELKWKYKVRIFIDESLSFGVLGKTGRGITEHFNIDPIDVDLIMVSLENSLASTGGFCCGRSYVIEHQRLSGLGYCFSASLPPLLTTAAIEALNIIEEEPQIFDQLKNNSIALHIGLTNIFTNTIFYVKGADISPLKLIACNDEIERKNQENLLDLLVKELLNNEIVVTRARYLNDNEIFLPQPVIKFMCNSAMIKDDIDKILLKMHKCVSVVISNQEVKTN